MEHVILVDEKDNELGTMEKMEAHRKALLHRAFSVFIFNSRGEMILQQRASNKYHSGGLWTNTCCSHPRPGESVKAAAQRRLGEEMGLKCSIHSLFSFVYKASLDNELTEHELDHVFVGHTNDQPSINLSEVMDWKYANASTIMSEVDSHPDNYTEWFKICLPELMQRLNEKQ
jgi:isopentenyl-diphosphate delta-isomerase